MSGANKIHTVDRNITHKTAQYYKDSLTPISIDHSTILPHTKEKARSKVFAYQVNRTADIAVHQGHQPIHKVTEKKRTASHETRVISLTLG